MHNRFKKDLSSHAAAAAPASNGHALSTATEASVRQLIANGKSKVAVEIAKEIYKAQPTAASEALLVDAYAARIQSLLDQNMAAEAKDLRELVQERYPSARQRLNGHNGSAAIQAGSIDDLVRPLNDPDLSAESRGAIESAVLRDVNDLAALAECAGLPPEHPLRSAASALHRAFLAVTAGPVGEEAVELPDVSRRSPLASSKLLVRAIACFYRKEDDACRRYLELINPESAAARLIPAMQAMLGGKPVGLTAAATALASSTTSDPAALRKALEALETAVASNNDGAIVKRIREAMQECRKAAPDQVERLKAHISVRCALADVSVGKVTAALGGAARRDAYFLRLFARGMEEIGDPENVATACVAWDEFRQQAVREGWFKANGPEAATLYLHMAGVLRKLPRELLEDLQRSACGHKKQSAEELYFLYPDKLYERACVLDPHFESFSQWTDWAKGGRSGQAEKVAEAWHKARPMDIDPILLVMEEKEKRNAFHTSLQYLAKAERIDSVHPAVRRARLRLLAGSVLRHLQQKKPNLAEEPLAEMGTLPQSLQGDRPAFLAALRYILYTVRGDVDGAAVHREEVERVLGSKAAAALLIFGVANAAKQGALQKLPPLEALRKTEKAALPEAVVRVLELAKDMQMSQQIPVDWMMETGKQFPRSSQSLNVGQLHILGEACLNAGQFELAYAVSAVGLERGAASEASFLLLRALSLRKCPGERWAVCALAAAQLARQQRDTEVVEKAVELLADSPFDDLSLDAEKASTVIRKEKAERTFPSAGRPGPNYSDITGEVLCNCPDCRRARGEAFDPFEDFEDEEEEDDAELDAIFSRTKLPPDMPPEIARMIFDEVGKAVQRGESLDSLVNRLFGPATGFGGRRKKGRRR